MKKKAIIFTIIFLLIIIIGGIFLTIKSHVHNNAKNEQANEYVTQKAQRVTPLTLSGHVSPKQERDYTVTSKELSAMKVQDGQQVTQGQTLFTTYSQANATELATLKTSLAKDQRDKAQATQKLQTAKNTLSQTNKDDDGYSDAQDAVTSASNDLDDLNSSISSTQTKINQVASKVSPSTTAPFAGNITITYDNSGNAKINLASTELQAIVQVSEYDYSKVKDGDNVTVRAVATNKKQNTNVTLVSLHPTSTNGSNGSKYNVYASVDGNAFIDGQTIQMTVTQTEIVVPESSLYKGKIFVVKNKKIYQKNVQGSTKGDTYIVTSGLNAGEKVITNPNGKLKDGESWPK
ncbi:efflux RND transporter periplasmic adaptor subunit [Liquorilactobacillus mali]|uniref:efflux RND transporter periplasmic adaptor subunit n=1 Tax=Liquorilactobacillus mali TaxID=1618 RepID=UPI0029535168|nr:HlyD family efflux transporter periplasmic adaptor subunit [Liquorilactobacillus mali]MDV7758685.1 HlyD family efflux transporter periplasmic adaptor subunit [Liquorilactobacillus mali]